MGDNLLRYLKVGSLAWAQSLQAQMAYKVDFLLGNFTAIVGQGVGIAFVWVIFQEIGELNGWRLPEIMLIYGLAALPTGLTALFFNGPWHLNYHVQSGEFDGFLVRPINPLFLILTEEAATHALGSLMAGLTIIAMASRELEFIWTPANLSFTGLMVLCGTLICVSISTITATVSFWFTGSGTATMFLVQRLREFSRYPLDIYSISIQVLLTWLVPYAFTGFFPATFLLGRGEYRTFVYGVPVVSLAWVGLAYGFWRAGLNRYESTGS